MLFDARWTGDIKSVAFTVFGREIAWYGIVVTLGMLTGLVLGTLRAKKVRLTSDDVLELFLFAIPFGVLFARLGYVVFRPEEFFVANFTWQNFVDIFAIWDGGLTIMTGVPGGVLGGYIWSKWRKVDFVAALDAILPVVLVSQAIGRWGNFFNQEIYGLPVTNTNWQFFPYSVYIEDRAGFFQATFFYESVLNLLFFAAIVIILRRLRLKGGGILLYAMSYSFIRFVMEFLRDDLGFYQGVNFNQIICIIITVVSAAVLSFLIVYQKKKGNRVWYKNGIPDELHPVAKRAVPKEN